MVLSAGDQAHGVVEGQAEELDTEVNGISSKVALRPTPIAVFDDKAGIGGQNEIARLLGDDLESAILKQRHEGYQSGGTDLFARPADGFRRWVGHSLSSNGAE